jgi:hypothetical protein
MPIVNPIQPAPIAGFEPQEPTLDNAQAGTVRLLQSDSPHNDTEVARNRSGGGQLLVPRRQTKSLDCFRQLEQGDDQGDYFETPSSEIVVESPRIHSTTRRAT